MFSSIHHGTLEHNNAPDYGRIFGHLCSSRSVNALKLCLVVPKSLQCSSAFSEVYLAYQETY